MAGEYLLKKPILCPTCQPGRMQFVSEETVAHPHTPFETLVEITRKCDNPECGAEMHSWREAADTRPGRPEDKDVPAPKPPSMEGYKAFRQDRSWPGDKGYDPNEWMKKQ